MFIRGLHLLLVWELDVSWLRWRITFTYTLLVLPAWIPERVAGAHREARGGQICDQAPLGEPSMDVLQVSTPSFYSLMMVSPWLTTVTIFIVGII